MKKIQHQLFMSSNDLEKTAFSQPLQDKISVFNIMHQKLQDTIGEDRKKLLGSLKILDLEIKQDMLEQMEDHLENNELSEPSEKKQNPKPQKELTDEQILEKLWNMGRTKRLKRSVLRKYGVKNNLSGWSTQIGNYVLYRTGTFTYTYKLEKITH